MEKRICSPAGRQIRFCGYPPAFSPFARFTIRIDETKTRRAGRHGRQTDSNAAFFEEGAEKEGRQLEWIFKYAVNSSLWKSGFAARPGGKSAFAAILPLFLRSRVSQYVSMKRKCGVPDGTATKRTAMRLSSKRGPGEGPSFSRKKVPPPEKNSRPPFPVLRQQIRTSIVFWSSSSTVHRPSFSSSLSRSEKRLQPSERSLKPG